MAAPPWRDGGARRRWRKVGSWSSFKAPGRPPRRRSALLTAPGADLELEKIGGGGEVAGAAPGREEQLDSCGCFEAARQRKPSNQG